nr:hypothetical protein [Tanacetum cinerariifolium]
MNGDEPVQTTRDKNGVETKVPPKTAQAILARQRERKAKSILLLAIPDEYQLRFHTIKDAKSLWDAIKSLDKAYDRFQKLISLLKVHGTTVSNEDANQKFLRALPSSWNNIALIMRNKELDIDDLYKNLKVFEADIKGSFGSSLNSQNVAFLFPEDTNSINEVDTANGVSTVAGHNSSRQASSSSYTNDLMFSFFASQSNSPQLDNEDLKQIDHDDLKEMDLKWQMAMLFMRVLTKPRLNALTVIDEAILQGIVEHQEIKRTGMEMQDGLGYDWSYIAQEEPTEFALIAYTLGSDTKDMEINEVKVIVKCFLVSLIVVQVMVMTIQQMIADLSFARLDDSVYRPTANKASASISKGEPSVIKTSNISVEMPRVDSVRTSRVIIKDWVSNDEDTLVDTQVDSQTTVKPSFKKIEFTKGRNESVKSDKQADKPKMVTQNSKADSVSHDFSEVMVIQYSRALYKLSQFTRI